MQCWWSKWSTSSRIPNRSISEALTTMNNGNNSQKLKCIFIIIWDLLPNTSRRKTRLSALVVRTILRKYCFSMQQIRPLVPLYLFFIPKSLPVYGYKFDALWHVRSDCTIVAFFRRTRFQHVFLERYWKNAFGWIWCGCFHYLNGQFRLVFQVCRHFMNVWSF